MKQYKMKKLQKKYINYRMVEINILTIKHSLFGIRTKRKTNIWNNAYIFA